MNHPHPSLLLLALAGLLALVSASHAADIELRIDPATATREFEGIGAVSAGASTRLLIDYPEPQRGQILDWLFLPKHGAGFTHLKVEVGGEINSTDGTEPTHARSREELDHPQREYFERGYEWWLMKEAKKRNPNIILDCLPWGAPGWIGNGNYFSQDMIDYLIGFIKGGKQFHDLDITLVGAWNEKFDDPEWVKNLRRALDERGLPQVKIVGGDMNGPADHQWKIAEQAAADPELAKSLYAIGVHYPWGKVPESVAKLRSADIRTWSSEHGEWDWQTMHPFLHKRANSMHLAFLDQGLTKINFWSPVTSYYNCLPAPRSGVVTANTPWSGAYEIAPTLWPVAHINQFAPPGWKFIDSLGCKLPKGGSVTGFASPDGKDLSIVMETTAATADQEIVIKPADGTAASVLHVWKTDMMEHFIQQPDLTKSNGIWTIKLAPNTLHTLTTTTGQRKGTAASPPPGLFPLPYLEDFESYKPNATARYLSDQGGAFEVVEADGGGQCLRQQVHRPGIDWAGGSYAYSVLGDDRWNDLEVTVDAAFETLPDDPKARSERQLGVLARWNPGGTWLHFKTPHPAGYHFRLDGDGRWELTTAHKIIASGKAADPGTGWHRLKLRCTADRITAFLDGKELAAVTDSTYQRGLAGVASRFHPARFDNLALDSPH
jgi:galactosylceramidase